MISWAHLRPIYDELKYILMTSAHIWLAEFILYLYMMNKGFLWWPQHRYDELRSVMMVLFRIWWAEASYDDHRPYMMSWDHLELTSAQIWWAEISYDGRIPYMMSWGQLWWPHTIYDELRSLRIDLSSDMMSWDHLWWVSLYMMSWG